MANSTVTPTQKPAKPKKRPSFKAVFTDEQVKSFEADHNETWGVKRRLTMITLSRSSKQLMDGFAPMIAEDDGEAFSSLLDQINDYRDHMKAGVELADAAMARLLWVGKYVTDSKKPAKS